MSSNPSIQTQNEPVVTLTDTAVTEVRALLSKESPGKTLRLFIEQGGCSGMQYGMVFDEPRDEDLETEIEGLRVVVDPFSAKYLRGAVVDFVESLTGGGFKISNPNARQSCGCGKSFTA